MAAEQGDEEAQYNLGLMYADGRGVRQDYVEAYAWISTAAVEGGGGGPLEMGPYVILPALRKEMTRYQRNSAVELSRKQFRRIEEFGYADRVGKTEAPAS